MPLYCSYKTRYIQPYASVLECAETSVPVQTQTKNGIWCSPPEPIVTYSLGNNFSGAIKTDGTLWMWGNGSVGRLGTDVTTDYSSPVQTIACGTNWCQMSLSRHDAGCHSAAIKTDGTLWLWGGAGNGRLGDGVPVAQKSSPVQTIACGTNWKQVDLGRDHSGAVKTDGTLWMWGNSNNGRLGNGCTSPDISSPVQTIACGTNWKQLSLAWEATFAIKCDGTLWAWGSTDKGTLGNLVASSTTVFSPIQTIACGTNWKQVSASSRGAAAVKTDGTLWLWGRNGCGQLGVGVDDFNDRSSPVQTICTGTNWRIVAASGQTGASDGKGNTVAVKTDGTLWLWGDGADAELGNNILATCPIPTQTVSATKDWLLPTSGYIASGGLKIDGTLWAWGNGDVGRLGDGTTTRKSSPVQTVSATTNWATTALSEMPYDTFGMGYLHAAAIKCDGTLWLWGRALNGELGNNSTITQSSPVQTVATGTNWKKVSLGCLYSAAIKTDGTLWLWGSGACGALGNISIVTQSSPVQTVACGTNWCQVSLGITHSAAIKTDGTLWLWGFRGSGRLGDAAGNSGYESSPLQTISCGTNWKQVSLGEEHSAAVKTDGTLWLWGERGNGRLGTGETAIASRCSPVQAVTTGTNWKQVSLGRTHSAAIKTDGTLWLWGNAGSAGSALGNNSTIDRSSPVQTVATGTNWKQVSAGQGYSTAIKTDGTLWVWGTNTCGRLGTNNTTDYSSPVQTACTGIGWSEVCASNSLSSCNTLAVDGNGILYAWGDNTFGQLNCSLFAGSIQNIDLGEILVDREYLLEVYPNIVPQIKSPALWGWGLNTCGVLGNNSTTNRSSPIQTVSNGTNWQQVSTWCGTGAVKTDGTLWMWGSGFCGRLGNNNTIDISSPVQTISTATDWKEVSVGLFHTGAIKTDGTLWMWGCNVVGALGDTSTTDKSSPVQTTTGGTNWRQVSVGGGHSLGIVGATGAGLLYAWGCGANGQLGIGDTINVSAQNQIAGTNWKQISAGYCHSAAVKSDGTLWLWGLGTCGRLGTGALTSHCSPVQTVATATNWKQVSLGELHSAAIKTDGSLWLWGEGASGRLGNFATGNQNSPVQTVTTGTNWKKVSLGCQHSAAIKTDGTLWLWGQGVSGQLGDNAATTRCSPVQTISTGNDWKDVSIGHNQSFAIRETYEW